VSVVWDVVRSLPEEVLFRCRICENLEKSESGRRLFVRHPGIYERMVLIPVQGNKDDKAW
jgi:hypothetical protein